MEVKQAIYHMMIVKKIENPDPEDYDNGEEDYEEWDEGDGPDGEVA